MQDHRLGRPRLEPIQLEGLEPPGLVEHAEPELRQDVSGLDNARSPKSLSSVSRARPSALVRASTSSSLMPAEVSGRRRRRGPPSSGAQLSPLHALISEHPGVSTLGSQAEDPEYLAGERDIHPRLRPSVLRGTTPLEAGLLGAYRLGYRL